MATLSEGQEAVQAAPSQAVVHLALLLGQTFMAGGSVVAKIGLPAANPLVFMLIREGLAALCVTVLARAREGPITCNLRDVPALALAALGLIGSHTLYLLGVKMTNPVICSAWQPAQPIFVLVLSVLLQYEICTVAKSAGVFCAFLGGLVMTVGSPHKVGAEIGDVSGNLIGNLLLLCQCLCMAISIMAMRTLSKRIRPLSMLALMYPIAWLALLVVVFVVGRQPDLHPLFCTDCGQGYWSVPLAMLPALAYFVLGMSVFANMSISFGTKHAEDATYCVAYTALQPVVASTFEAGLVSAGWNDTHPGNPLELPSEVQVCGACVVILGIACIIFDAWSVQVRQFYERVAAEAAVDAKSLMSPRTQRFYSDVSTDVDSVDMRPRTESSDMSEGFETA